MTAVSERRLGTRRVIRSGYGDWNRPRARAAPWHRTERGWRYPLGQEVDAKQEAVEFDIPLGFQVRRLSQRVRQVCACLNTVAHRELMRG